MAVHMRYNSWYISFTLAKQQHEITKFCVVWRVCPTRANFAYFYQELNTFIAYSAGAIFNAVRYRE